jgi:hypothetical protein
MISCKICDRECKSFRSLSKHICQKHHYTPKQYYDEFINPVPPSCLVCGTQNVSFINLGAGYNSTCSHKCGGTLHRANLRKDSSRYAEFVGKVSSNQKAIWESRNQNETGIIIRNKIGNTIKAINETLTEHERSEKFGWMKRLSPEQLEIWKKQKMFSTGAHNWWKTANENEKSLVYKKRNAARAGLSLEAYDNIARERIQEYYTLVGYYTGISYRKYIDSIDPDKKRGKDYHLDHKYSVLRGFYDGVPPEVLGSAANLEIIPASDNVKKSAKCSITLEELMESYYAQI